MTRRSIATRVEGPRRRPGAMKRPDVAVLAAALAAGLCGLAHLGRGAAQEQPTGATARVAVSPAEQVANARAAVQRGSVLAQRLAQMLEEARREADIIRVTCLNDKLTQVNANMRTAQARLNTLETASDPEQRSHEATVLVVLGQKFNALEQEANRCIGQDLYETGSTKVTTEIDRAQLPFEDDVTTPPPPPSAAVPIVPLTASGTD